MRVNLMDNPRTPLFLLTGRRPVAQVKFDIEWLNDRRVSGWIGILSIVHPNIYPTFCNAIRTSDPFYL
jgi:hypothetical protein